MIVLKAVWIVSIALRFAVAAKLAWIAPKRFRWFAIYLTASVILSVILARADVSARAYYETWIVGEPVTLLLLTIAAREVFTGFARTVPSMSGERELSGYARIMAGTLSLTAAGGGIAFGFLDVPAIQRRFGIPLIVGYLLLKRLTTGAVALFLVLSIRYFHRTGIWIPRNAKRHAYLFTAAMLIETLEVLGALTSGTAHVANLAGTTGWAICYACWLLAITKAGEAATHPPALTAEQRETSLRQREGVLKWLETQSRRVLRD